MRILIRNTCGEQNTYHLRAGTFGREIQLANDREEPVERDTDRHDLTVIGRPRLCSTTIGSVDIYDFPLALVGRLFDAIRIHPPCSAT